jgi:hypothetical protein
MTTINMHTLVPTCVCVSIFNRKSYTHPFYLDFTKKFYLGSHEFPRYRNDIHTYIGTKVPVSTSSCNGTGGYCLV